MIKASITIVSAVVLSLGASVAALAQASSPYTVVDVHIDARADTATEAQSAALAQGQLAAAERLIARLTLEQDRLSLMEPLMLSQGEAATMVAGLQIANEQRSATRYIGDLTVNFDRREVAAYLNARQLPFVESQARPMLVLPVLDNVGGASLWAGPWYQAWQETNFSHSLTPVVALGTGTPEGEPPLGRTLITADDVLNRDQMRLAELADLYGVDQIAIVVARESDGYVRVSGELVTRLDLEPSDPSDDTQPSQDPYAPGPIVPLFERETLPELGGEGGFVAAAERFVAFRETQWKEASIVRDLTEHHLEVSVLFRSLGEWRDLQTAIAGASLVQDARLDALSRDGAVMQLSYRGAQDQLESELRERGAVLREDTALGWTVESRR